MGDLDLSCSCILDVLVLPAGPGPEAAFTSSILAMLVLSPQWVPVSSPLCGCRAAQPPDRHLCWLQQNLEAQALLCPGGMDCVTLKWVKRKDPGVICTTVEGLQLTALLEFSLKQ